MVRLKPAGFPLKDVAKSYPINITDEKLFGIYAREQWMGTAVEKGDYLFDQRVIPDFAFKVTKVLPLGEVTISDDTTIFLEDASSENKPKFQVLLDDVIGHEEIKKKFKIIIKYLTDPAKFGEWAPKNILFYGPPGTGKTMTAKALANETNSNLFLIRATDLIGEYVGDGSKRIHELYRSAQDNAPTVIFVDELDAIGLDRSFQSVRGDVSEVVNALLTELEGLSENKGVVTIAATNNPNMLDRALRSRFEIELMFNMPNYKERLAIIEQYSKRLPIKIRTDMKDLAKRTEGFSGRDIKEKVLKSSLHRALVEDEDIITQEHIEASLKAIPGTNKPPKGMFS